MYSALWAINEVRKNADMPLLTSMGKESKKMSTDLNEHVEQIGVAPMVTVSLVNVLKTLCGVFFVEERRGNV